MQPRGTSRRRSSIVVVAVSLSIVSPIETTTSAADGTVGTITTVVGANLAGGGPTDGADANSVAFGQLQRVALDATGSIIFTDQARETSWRSDGALQRIAGLGTGAFGFSGDGGPATSAAFGFRSPTGVAIGPDGATYLADKNNHRIRRVDGAGIVTTIAGCCGAGFAGDGGPATQAQLNNPDDIAFDSAGNLYLVDLLNRRVRRIDTAGVITTVAGNGSTTYLGDGALATATGLEPSSLTIAPDGSLTVGNGYPNARIIRLDTTSGTITTIAGNGISGFGGDGGPATSAQLGDPKAVAVDPSGAVFIADAGNNRVRRVDPITHVIDTAAGNGLATGGPGDGSLATSVALNVPWGLALMPNGDVLVVEQGYGRIRRVVGIAAPELVPVPAAITASVAPKTPLWKIDLTGDVSSLVPTTCSQTLHAVVVIVDDQARRRKVQPKICDAGGTPTTKVKARWPVFINGDSGGQKYLLQPDRDYVATVTIKELGESVSSTIHTPKAPVWVAVGDSYSSGHHQNADLPWCTSLDATCGLFENDPLFAWPSRAVTTLNANRSVPAAWRMTTLVAAQSGQTTGQYGNQRNEMVSQLAARAGSWNVVSLNGGGNDVDLISFIGAWYATHAFQMLETPGPWAISGDPFSSPQEARDTCPRTDLEYFDLQLKKTQMYTNLQTVINEAEAASSGVRLVDVTYPYVVDTSNPCNLDYSKRVLGVKDTFKGAKALVDGIAQVHGQLQSVAMYRVDLRTSQGFGTTPMAYLQTTRLFGYPHANESGQNKVAELAAKRVK
jgi:streptogramin lyase